MHKFPLAQKQVFKGHPLCVLNAPAGFGGSDPQKMARLGHALPQALARQTSAGILAHTPAEFGILRILKGGMGAPFQGKQHQQGRRVQKWHALAPPSLERVPADPCPSGRCFKISRWMSVTYGLGAFQPTVFALVCGVLSLGMSPLKWEFSISYSLLATSHAGFQSQVLWCPPLWCRSQGLGYMMWGSNTLPLRDMLCIREIPPTCGLPWQEWGFWQDQLSASPTFLDLALLSFVVELLLSLFSGLFQGELFYR